MILKQIRMQKHLTQLDVATYLDISTRQYQYIEAGTSFLKQEKLNKLEDLFKLPQRVLLASDFNDIPYYYHCFMKDHFGTDTYIINNELKK